ncbi:MAG: LUD domain-containing protein [Halofilum sp. (in: g-proteobacteria)]
MSARDTILGRIRARRAGHDPDAVAERLRAHPAGPMPARAGGTAAEIRERFVAMAEKAGARVEALASTAALPELVARLCAEQGWDPEVAVAPDGALTRLDWATAGVYTEVREAAADDRICISRALCGVAETGTAVLRSGPESPVTLGFLPEWHVVSLAAEDLVGGYEDAWARVRAAGAMPRTVNWITGPSRSADIEQTIQIGAHGPRGLVIALY